MTEGVLCTNASINKLVIAKMPTCSVTQDVTGKTAQEIFSTDLLIQEIKKSAEKLQLDIHTLHEKSLPLYLESCLLSGDAGIVRAANDILRLFGERLAIILLCLKEGSPENKKIRTDWTDAHWKYWDSLQQIILVGGLASPPMGNRLKHYVNQVFADSGKRPYTLTLGENSAYAGIRGCTTYLASVSGSHVHLIFDYGQSFIKRSYVVMEDRTVRDMVILEKTLSEHVEWDITDPVREENEAILLNNHFLQAITHTIEEVENRGLSINPHIIMSIANYVKDGVLVDRGGYGKLRLIAPNYGVYLSEQLKKITGKTFHFTLIHDGTAMAAGYSGFADSVCLSLGTAFGVGFPPEK